MDFEASDKPNFCVGDDNGNLLVSCEDFDDDIPLSQMIPSLGTCGSKCDGSVKKRDFEFHNNNSLHVSVKKSKLSPYHDHGKDEGDIPLVKKSTDKSFSSLNKDLTLLEKLFEECKRKQKVEEKRLQSIKRDIQKCCKELENKKKQVSCVRRIDEAREKVQGKIDECIEDFVVKERQLYFLEDLIGEREQELMAKEIELNQVKGNISKEIELCQVIDKDRERKEEELKALSEKIVECTMELKAKEKDLDAMNRLIGGQAEKLESEKKKLLQVTFEKENGHAQMKKLESMNKRLEGQVKELESKGKQCEGRVEDLESKEKHFEVRVKELMSREKQLEEHMTEFGETHEKMQGKIEECIEDFVVKEVQLYLMEDLIGERKQELKTKEIELIQVQGNISKEKHYKGRAEELESQEKHLEGRVKELESREKQLEGHMKEFESKEKGLEDEVVGFKSKEKEFECQMKELVSEKKHFESRMEELESNEKQLESRLKEHESIKREFEGQVKEMESKKNLFERQVKDFESKVGEFEGRVKELESEKKNSESRLKDLESKEKQFKVQMKDFQSKDEEFKGQVKELESKKEEFEGRVKELKSKEKQLEGRWKELESKENKFKEKVKELDLKEKQFPESRKKYTDEEKESDFVEMLIRKKKFVGAVRFRGAYNLADKNQLVDLLREHALNAKQICESSCKKTNSIEIKDKARDEEIASLGTVLQCISDYNLQSEVLLEKEIRYRILELQAHKGK